MEIQVAKSSTDMAVSFYLLNDRYITNELRSKNILKIRSWKSGFFRSI
jgi:hypothetical protein